MFAHRFPICCANICTFSAQRRGVTRARAAPALFSSTASASIPASLSPCSTLAWEDDTLRIHDASQAVAHEAWTIAQVFGLKEKQVRLTSPFVGGGFGSKLLW
jgi:hypothetical protein